MTTRNANIITCPFCGTQKELMSLGSSNNIGAQYWSDLKTIAPMDPKISPVQKCPNCGKYYLEYKLEPTTADKESWEMGKLSYWEWKEAYMQFCTELGNSISPKDILNVQGWLLQAYNDYFYRNKALVHPSDEEQRFITNIIKTLIETIEWGDTTDALFPGGVSFAPPERETQVWSSRLNPIIKAELYREIGDFQKCDKLIQSLKGKPVNSFDNLIGHGIMERTKRHEMAVFKFYDEREQEADDHPKQVERSVQNNSNVAVDRTMLKCPNCGKFTPGPKCIYCGAELYTPSNSVVDKTPTSNAQSTGRFIHCSNGHYYSADLDFCPYCRQHYEEEMNPNAKTQDSIISKLREFIKSEKFYVAALIVDVVADMAALICGILACFFITTLNTAIVLLVIGLLWILIDLIVISWLGFKFVSSKKCALPDIQGVHFVDPHTKTAEPIIYIDGHGYEIIDYYGIASFACWSEENRGEYLRFWLWKSNNEQEDYDDFTLRIKSNTAFEIPREIECNGKLYPVTRIGKGAFAFCEIDGITIPDTVKAIDPQAFFRCDGVKKLVIPDSVKDLPKEAISECKDLKTITWQGITYEDDIDELFLFPDNKDKYAIIVAA